MPAVIKMSFNIDNIYTANAVDWAIDKQLNITYRYAV